MTPFRICLMTAFVLFAAVFAPTKQEPSPTPSFTPENYVLVDDSHRDAEILCLARNIYFEARGESIAGQIAVGQVTLNRAKANTFPDSVCGVVREKHHGVCQFTWFCHNRSLVVRDRGLFANIMLLATTLYDGYYISNTIPDLVDGATYFQRSSHHMTGGNSSVITAHIDHQFFYRVANT